MKPTPKCYAATVWTEVKLKCLAPDISFCFSLRFDILVNITVCPKNTVPPARGAITCGRTNQAKIKLAKLFIAGLFIIGLIVLAAQDLAPNISHAKLFAYIFIGLAALAVNLVGLSVIYLNVYQWVLRKD